MTRGLHRYWSIALFSIATVGALSAVVACGGSTPPAEEPTASTGPVIPEKTEATPPSEEDAPKPDAESTKPKKEEVAEPAFTPDMSVEDAIKAAASAERLNVDQEELGKPLQDPDLYAPCKVGTAHFKLRVAIWRGKAVAIDLSTTPKNPKLEACLKDRLHELTWPAKVPSLNTVSYAM
jgi:hypothetical protein